MPLSAFLLAFFAISVALSLSAIKGFRSPGHTGTPSQAARATPSSLHRTGDRQRLSVCASTIYDDHGRTAAESTDRDGSLRRAFPEKRSGRVPFYDILLAIYGGRWKQPDIPVRLKVPGGGSLLPGKKPEEIAAIISRVFGIVDVSICTRVDSTPEALRDAAVSLALSRLHPPCRFAVRAKRQSKTGHEQPAAGRVCWICHLRCDSRPLGRFFRIRNTSCS